MRLGSLFSGIGAWEIAFQEMGIDYDLQFFCELDKFASKAYCLIHNESPSKNLGDVTRVEEKKLPELDMLVYSPPCFVEGTLVKTEDGYKEIQDIESGDKVLTHKNRYREVIVPMQKQVTELFEVKLQGIEKIYTTKEHPFYVIEKSKVWENSIRRYKTLYSEPKWVEAKDLNKSHLIGIPINTISELPDYQGIEMYKNKSIINSLPLDNPNFWWVVGRYLGDGWLRSRDREGYNTYTTLICCGYGKENDISERLEGLYHYNISNQRTTKRFEISSKELHHFLESFGQYAYGKIVPEFVQNLPTDLLKSFLDGYMSADGSYSNNIYSVSSVSRELIYGIARCIHKVYKVPANVCLVKVPKTHIIEGRVVNQRNYYQLRYNLNLKKSSHYNSEDYIWIQFNTSSVIPEYTTVYNMEVAEDNSYTIFNCSVHNCQSWSVAGKMKGYADRRGILFFDALRIIEKTRPKIAMMENVKGLTTKKFAKEFEGMLGALEDLGYVNRFHVLNTKDYGLPQNRERLFLVSMLEDFTYNVPEKVNNGLRLKDMLEDKVDEKFYISEEKVKKLIESLKAREREEFLKNQELTSNLTLPCLTPDRAKKRQNGRRFKEDGDPMFTLTSQDRHGILQVEIPVPVRVRKHEVDIESLKTCLKSHKAKSLLSNKDIAEALEVKESKVAHWFRSDTYFSVPDEDIWFKLKELLNIQTTEFDMSVTEFIEKEGVFDRTNRFYFPHGICPTITATDENRIIQNNENISEVYVREVLDCEGNQFFILNCSCGHTYKESNLEVPCPNCSTISEGTLSYLYELCEPPTEEPKIMQVGNLVEKSNFRNPQRGRIYSPQGICPSIDTMQGGGQEPKIVQKELEPTLVGGVGEQNFGKQFRQGNRVYDSNDCAMCLLANPTGNLGGNSYLYLVREPAQAVTKGEVFGPFSLIKNTEEIIECVNGDVIKAELDNKPVSIVCPNYSETRLRIRKLTPKECWRLQGFPDKAIDKCIENGISNTQLYKMAGNSISVCVIKALIKELGIEGS